MGIAMQESFSDSFFQVPALSATKISHHTLDELVSTTNAVTGAIYVRRKEKDLESEKATAFELRLSRGRGGADRYHPSETLLESSILKDSILEDRIPLWIDSAAELDLRQEFQRCFFDRVQEYPVAVAIPIVHKDATQSIFVLVWNDNSFSRTGIRSSLCRSLESYCSNFLFDDSSGYETVRISTSIDTTPNPTAGSAFDSCNDSLGSNVDAKSSDVAACDPEDKSDSETCCRLWRALCQVITENVKSFSSDSAILKTIQEMAKAGGFQRAGILQNVKSDGQAGRGFWKVLHEWALSDYEFQSELLPGLLDWHQFPNFDLAEKMFIEGVPVDGIRSDQPPEIQSFMESVGTFYTVNIPMFLGGRWWGVLAFDDCIAEQVRSQEEMSVLIATAQYLSNAMTERQNAENQRLLTQKIAMERELALVSRLEANERVNAMIRTCASTLSNTHFVAEVIEEIIFSILESQHSGGPLLALLKRPGEDDQTVNLLGLSLPRPCVNIRGPINPIDILGAEVGKSDYGWTSNPHFDWKGRFEDKVPSGLIERVKSTAYFRLHLNDGESGYLLILLESEHPPRDQDVAAIEARIHQLILALELECLASKVRLSGRIEERNHLARDIHDTLAQMFLGIVLQLTKLETSTESDTSINREVQLALDLAKQGLQEARRSLRVLRGQTQSTRDIRSELQSIVDFFKRVSTMEVELVLPNPLPTMSFLVTETIVRIASESLGNAVRHSQGSRITLSMHHTASGIRLQISDNGKGISSEKPKEIRFGLLGMLERAECIGGTLTITSIPNQGTSVEFSIPIECLERN